MGIIMQNQNKVMCKMTRGWNPLEISCAKTKLEIVKQLQHHHLHLQKKHGRELTLTCYARLTMKGNYKMITKNGSAN
jgi:hypothetical protein